MSRRKNISQQILRAISDRRYSPKPISELAEWIGIGVKELGEFRDAIKALHRSGRVALGEGDMVFSPEPRGQIIGTYRANPRGFGFVVPEAPAAHGDLFIPPGQQLDAVTGDTVQAKVSKKNKPGKGAMFEGRIVKVLERGHNRFVGRLQQSGSRWFVHPDGNTLHVPIFLSDVGAKNAKPNTQVVVELIQYPSDSVEARGVIVEVLGKHGDAGVDTRSIIWQFHLSHEFPEDCLKEARAVALNYDPKKLMPHRNYLKNEVIITIDPDDARDFDDAISIQQLPDGWELGVHIADVSYFVSEGSALDREAKLRGNSVYFPGHVIPMLPETLSNGVCSLQEAQPRLTKSAFIKYDAHGQVIGQRFSNSMICSAKRFTYGQVTEILEGKTGRYDADVLALIRKMDVLARTIQKRRISQGMLSLDLPSVELILDDQGKATGVEPEDQSFSHTIIEMFMVEANEAVSRLFTHLKVPHLRRIHPEPETSSAEQLSSFLGFLGIRSSEKMDRFELQRILESVKGRPDSFTINLAILKSMQTAEYSPKMEEHYALASQHYSHFTSPIRRYPDLVIHRLLDLYLNGLLQTAAQRSGAPSQEQLIQLGQHCSYTERRAEDAERELRLLKILTLLQDQVGNEFRGVVCGVTSFGIFIQIDHYLVEGLVRLDSLSDDWWEVVPEAGCIIGQRTGRRITIGDLVKVAIVRIDLSARQMELALVQQLSSRGRSNHKPSKKNKQQKHRPRSPKRSRKRR